MTPGEAAVMNARVGGALASAVLKFATSRRTALESFRTTGPLQVGNCTVELSLRCQSGKSAAYTLGKAGRGGPSNPVKRSLTYVAYDALPVSPSETTSMPCDTWRRTTSTVAAATRSYSR